MSKNKAWKNRENRSQSGRYSAINRWI